MKEKDATFLVKSMIGCLSPDLSVSKITKKNIVMTEGEEIIDSFVKLRLGAWSSWTYHLDINIEIYKYINI